MEEGKPMARLVRRLGLAAVLALVSGCGGGGGGGLSAAAAVSSICQEMLSCGLIDSSELEPCRTAFSAIEMVIANPQRTVTCVQGLSCAQLADLDYALDTCIAYDFSQFACQSGTVLQVCNTYHECRDVDCDEACGRLLSAPGTCGYSSADGHDECLCYL
jgi:hypothetical protein